MLNEWVDANNQNTDDYGDWEKISDKLLTVLDLPVKYFPDEQAKHGGY